MFGDDNVKDVQSVLFQVQWQTRLHIWLQGAGKIWNCCGKSDYCSKEDCQDMNIWKSGNNVLFLCFASICCLEILLCTLWFGINHQLNKIIQLFIDVAKQYRSQYSGPVLPLQCLLFLPNFTSANVQPLFFSFSLSFSFLLLVISLAFCVSQF